MTGMLGRQHSWATRVKIGKAQLGRKRGPETIEHRTKIANALLAKNGGAPMTSVEYAEFAALPRSIRWQLRHPKAPTAPKAPKAPKAKAPKAPKGRSPMSAEHRAKISAGRTGRAIPICSETLMILEEIAAEHSISLSDIGLKVQPIKKHDPRRHRRRSHSYS